MSENKHNIDRADLERPNVPDGNRHPTGTSTHEKNRLEKNLSETRDHKVLGTVGRKGKPTGGV
jgi:hypothetical protein